jgi:small subunit ribosomal protein S6
MRRYELMLVVRPDTADEQVDAIVDKATKSVTTSGGQIVKRSPWGRRRLAYPIGQHREGSYHILLFDAPPDAVLELERGLNITEEVMRHLVTRVERPLSRRPSSQAGDGAEIDDLDAALAPPPPDVDEEEIDNAFDTEFIDESESEAAPAAVERA